MFLNVSYTISMSIDSPEIGKEQELTAFLDKITRADGELIPLAGTSRLGEPLFIFARYGQDLYHPDPNLYFLNVDIVAKRGDTYVAVGIKDYEVYPLQKKANGNKQRHGHLPSTHSAHEVADSSWGTGEGLHVKELSYLNYALNEIGGFEGMNKLRREGVITDEEQWGQQIYQQWGLGRLLIATSAFILKSKGIETLQFGSLSKNAQKAWSAFGYTDSQNQHEFPVEEVTKSPAAKKAITKFL